jgi:hypothetical protein
MGNAGVVDEDVEAAELLPRGAEEIVDGLRLADVTGVGEDLDFRGGEFPVDASEGGFAASAKDQVAGFVG